MSHPERSPKPRSPERPNPTAEAAGEQLERLKKSPERSAEHDKQSQERAAEHARQQAELEAVFGKEAGGERKQATEPDEPARRAVKRSKQQEYQQTLHTVQAQLPDTSRSFSRLIHKPVVEKASEAVGASVARPNQILWGGLVALIAVVGVQLVARHYGFPLSGFELIGAFIIGWLVGTGLDGLRAVFVRRA